MTKLQPGEIIDDRYLLVDLLGEGGMGSVFKAQELGLERVVAIKFLQNSLLSEDQWSMRFEREAKVLSGLAHVNIVRFYRFGMLEEHYPYMVMEYVQGESLRALSAKHQLTIEQSVAITIQVCDALQDAHKKDIVHRDLKPENILVMQNREDVVQVKVVDFGLASIRATSSQQLTRTGMIVGSLPYMSPEQCIGEKSDERSDVYSLGCILYELIAGRVPFTSQNPMGLIHQHATVMPPRLTKPVNGVTIPRGLEAVIFKTLAKEPESRYQSMEDLQRDLELVLDGQPANVSAGLLETRQGGTLHYIAIGAALLAIIGTVAFARYNMAVVASSSLSDSRNPDRVKRTHRHAPEGALREASLLGELRYTDKAAQVKSLKESLLQANDAINELSHRSAPDFLTFQAYIIRADTLWKLTTITKDVEFARQANKDCITAERYGTLPDGRLARITAGPISTRAVIYEECLHDNDSADRLFRKAVVVFESNIKLADENGINLGSLPPDFIFAMRSHILRLAHIRGDKTVTKQMRSLIDEWSKARRGDFSTNGMQCLCELADLYHCENNCRDRDAMLAQGEKILERDPLLSHRAMSDVYSILAESNIRYGHLDVSLRQLRRAVEYYTTGNCSSRGSNLLLDRLAKLSELLENDHPNEQEEIKALMKQVKSTEI